MPSAMISRAALEAYAAKRGPAARLVLSLLLQDVDAEEMSAAAKVKSDSDELPKR